MMTTTTESALEERVEELEARDDHDTTYRHEDGSVTLVHRDYEPYDYESPRDYAGNIATLIMESSDYLPLDSDDAGLSEARDRWDWLGTHGYSSRGQSFPYEVSKTQKALTRYDRAGLMDRYVAMFRPDIAYYCDRWEVSGYTQSDWAGGWGYVTHDALAEAGVPADYSAEQAFEAEREVYELHFRGDYYYAVHLSAKEPALVSTVIDYGTEPIESHGNDYDEETCYGFLGYGDLKDIAWQFTSSPVV